MSLLIAPEIVDRARRNAAISRLKDVGGFLPTWSDLADPLTAANGKAPDLAGIDPDAPHGANLWRVHWFNASDRKSRLQTPAHVVLPPHLTGRQGAHRCFGRGKLSIDRRPQGARRLRLLGTPAYHWPV